MRRRLRGVARLAVPALLLALAAEAGLRLVRGERLLYLADPLIEYMPAPDQAVTVRGVNIRTNTFGMRSPPLADPASGEVVRILVVGDSVVFGFTNIGHDALATSLLSRLRTDEGAAIEALNVSASSWGPGNMLAWIERFGMFAARSVVLVLSTHDLSDDRTFSAPDPGAFPQTAPLSALGDLIWRRLAPPPPDPATPDPRMMHDAQRALPALFAQAAAAPAGGCLIVHPTREELQAGAPGADELRLQAAAEAAGLSVRLGREFLNARDSYVDDIHLSASGQQDLARAILTCPGIPAAAEPGPPASGENR